MIPTRVYHLFFVFIAATLIFSAYAWAETADSVDPANKITVIYIDKDQTLTVTFDIANDSVEVKLPDGRKVELPRAISASGVRYTDGKEIFWEHQDEGAYWVGEVLIFRGKKKD